MGKRCISNEDLSSTGFSYTLSLINGKYKMTILYTLMEFGVVRFNEMKNYSSSEKVTVTSPSPRASDQPLRSSILPSLV